MSTTMEGQTAVLTEDTDPLLGPIFTHSHLPEVKSLSAIAPQTHFILWIWGTGWFLCLYHLAVVTAIEYASH